MNKLVKVFLGLGVAAASMLAQAGVVYSAGALSREEGSAIIHDSLNNREWLGWDVVRSWTYAETLAKMGVGGAYAGFKLAHSSDARAFLNALLPNGQCDGVGFGVMIPGCSRQSMSSPWEMVVGESSSATAYGRPFLDNLLYKMWDYDGVNFLSDSGGAGEFEVRSDYIWRYQNLVISESAMSIAASDLYSGSHPSSFGWLVYRDMASAPIPEPSSASLLGAALLGWLGVRRRVKTSG